MKFQIELYDTLRGSKEFMSTQLVICRGKSSEVSMMLQASKDFLKGRGLGLMADQLEHSIGHLQGKEVVI